MLATIALEGLEFFAYHGVYEEERKNGNQFEVDLFVDYDVRHATKSDDLQHTLDYAVLYEIVRGCFEGSDYLIEYLAGKIISSIKKSYPEVKNVKVKVSKINPPIGGTCDRASVTIMD